MNNNRKGMSLIVKTVTDWLKAFLLLFGIHLVLYGHLTPGGGFSGGVVIAAAFILLVLAYGQQKASQTLSKSTASILDSVGALMFLCIAVLGMTISGAFFRNFITTSKASYFKLFSSGTIPLCNIAIGLKVGMSLSLVFAVLAAFHVSSKGQQKEIQEEGDR